MAMSGTIARQRRRLVRWSVAMSLVASLALPALALPGAAAAVTAGPFTISGRVLNYAADPLAGIRVAFCTAVSTCTGTSSRADGTFVSPPLPTASYRIRFTDPASIYAAGYATSGNTTDRWSRATVVHLTSNRSGITANMLPGTGIYGVVTGAGGEPLANAVVTACGVPDEICGRGRSGPHGAYRVVVGEGLFTVRVTAKVSGETLDGYIGQFGLTFSRARAVRLLGQPGAVHGASVQLTRAPRTSFVTGSRLGSSSASGMVPIRVAWAAGTDAAASYTLRNRQDLGPVRQVARVAANSFTGSITTPLRLGHSDRFDVRASTRGTGGTALGPLHAGPEFDLLLVQESSSQIVYDGSWTPASGGGRSGGRASVSASTGATATFTFTGHAVGWVTRTGPDAGMAQVFVDGRFAGSFDLSSDPAAVRTLIFTRSWPAAGTHTVQVSEAGIGDHHPPIEVDAFVVMH